MCECYCGATHVYLMSACTQRQLQLSALYHHGTWHVLAACACFLFFVWFFKNKWESYSLHMYQRNILATIEPQGQCLVHLTSNRQFKYLAEQQAPMPALKPSGSAKQAAHRHRTKCKVKHEAAAVPSLCWFFCTKCYPSSGPLNGRLRCHEAQRRH